jgi:hypothetical protein
MMQGVEVGDWSATQQPLPTDDSSIDAFRADVLCRLQLIEQKLGMSSTSFTGNMMNANTSSFQVPTHDSGRDDVPEDDEQNVTGLPDVQAALQTLVAWSTDKQNEGWSPHVIEALWLA